MSCGGGTGSLAKTVSEAGSSTHTSAGTTAAESTASYAGNTMSSATITAQPSGSGSQYRRLIAVAVDNSRYAEYAMRWALKYVIQPRTDEVIVLNCRPVVTLASLYAEPLFGLSDHLKHRIAASTTNSNVAAPTSSPTGSTEPTLTVNSSYPDVESPPPLSETVESPPASPAVETNAELPPNPNTIVTFQEPLSDVAQPSHPAPGRRVSRRASWKTAEDDISKAEQRNKEDSHELLKKYCARLLDRQILCRGVALRGDAKDEVVRKVEELQCDMLILGARGQGAQTNPLAIPNLVSMIASEGSGYASAATDATATELVEGSSADVSGNVASASSTAQQGVIAAIKKAFPNTVAAVAAAGSLGTVSEYAVSQSSVPVVVAKAPLSLMSTFGPVTEATAESTDPDGTRRRTSVASVRAFSGR
ncbi:hypothetical protein BJ742DRAFT_780303 [Cladochytrium replicatum]|nr:hypothetical protein BJ742DRAFT_780303 [Cladochytrium replicatum]